MVNCSVMGCKSRSESKQPNITFHTFLQDDDILSVWLRATGRYNWMPTKYSRICSKHFEEHCFRKSQYKVYVDKFSIPTLFIHNIPVSDINIEMPQPSTSKTNDSTDYQVNDEQLVFQIMEEEFELNKENEMLEETCKCFEPKFGFVNEETTLNSITRIENYLVERRIPELIHFLLTKLLVDAPNKPIIWMEKLLNDCMLFRAGHGVPPVLYGDSHLEAVIKSFDPGQREWLTAGQTRRAFMTLGLEPPINLDERIACNVVFDMLKRTQEDDLFNLLSAGCTQKNF